MMALTAVRKLLKMMPPRLGTLDEPDPSTASMTKLMCEIFECECDVFPVAIGINLIATLGKQLLNRIGNLV